MTNPLLIRPETGKTKQCSFDLPDACFGVPSRRDSNDYTTAKLCLNLTNDSSLKPRSKPKNTVLTPTQKCAVFGIANPPKDPNETNMVLHQCFANVQPVSCNSSQSTKPKLRSSVKVVSKKTSEEAPKEPFKLKKFQNVPSRVFGSNSN
ncbi:hypothetical protein RCL1_001231 [Eukaryota sp. TZLM3-RCL]